MLAHRNGSRCHDVRRDGISHVEAALGRFHILDANATLCRTSCNSLGSSQHHCRESSRGRVFSNAQLTGIFTTWITLPVVLIVVPNSWEFYILYTIAITLVKVIVISFANAHITSLDSARDLSFVDAVQADAIYDILSGQVRPRQMARQESSNSESPWRRRERVNSLSSALPRSFQEPRSDFRFREDLVEIEKRPHQNDSPVRFTLDPLDRLRSQSLSSDGLPDPPPIRSLPDTNLLRTEAPIRSLSKGPHEASPF